MKANKKENNYGFDKTGLQPIGGQAKAGNAPQMWFIHQLMLCNSH